MDQYLNQNKLVMPTSKTVTPSSWEDIVLSMKGGKKYSFDIEKLISVNPDLEKAITGRISGYTLTISLDDIHALIPKGGKKQRSSYSRLIEFMKVNLGIILIIPDNRKTPKHP